MEELSEFLSRGGIADTSTILEADATSPKQQQQPAVTQPDTKDKDVSIPELKKVVVHWTLVSLHLSCKKGLDTKIWRCWNLGNVDVIQNFQ